MQIRLTGYTKLSIVVTVFMNGCLAFWVSPVIDCPRCTPPRPTCPYRHHVEVAVKMYEKKLLVCTFSWYMCLIGAMFHGEV